MMLRIRNIQILLTVFFFALSGQVLASDCRNEWSHPSTQTMTMDSEVSFTFTGYKNNERHFSVHQGPDQGVDIYYLKGVILIKGYSDAQIEKLASNNSLFTMPVVFAVPSAVLFRAEPQGPCNVGAKKQFSVKLPDGMKLQNRMLSSSMGQVYQSAPNAISYDYSVTVDPPEPNKASVRYSGTMSFAPQEESPSDDTAVAGYTIYTAVTRHSRPFPVAGSKGVPAILGELRRFFASGQKEM